MPVACHFLLHCIDPVKRVPFMWRCIIEFECFFVSLAVSISPDVCGNENAATKYYGDRRSGGLGE